MKKQKIRIIKISELRPGDKFQFRIEDKTYTAGSIAHIKNSARICTQDNKAFELKLTDTCYLILGELQSIKN